jgi:hypothetical protein
VVGRLLEGPRLLVPLGAVGPETLKALLGAPLVEAREWDRLAGGVDAVHQRLLWSQRWLAPERDERLDPRARSRRSNLARLRVVGHPVGTVIATLVEPSAIVVKALAVALVIVDHVYVVLRDTRLAP